MRSVDPLKPLGDAPCQQPILIEMIHVEPEAIPIQSSVEAEVVPVGAILSRVVVDAEMQLNAPH
jgi:hypothetical protein